MTNWSDRDKVFQVLDPLTEGRPFTHLRICHLLYDLASAYPKPEIVEVSCGFGKASVYLAAAARGQRGHFWTVDSERARWEGLAADELIAKIGLDDVSELSFGSDARWYLLELFAGRPQLWIDVAYLDASHTIETDAFIALALWTHIRPGGLLIFDDLDWIPEVHGPPNLLCSYPNVSHIERLYEYIRALPTAGRGWKVGKDEVEWTWGIVQKAGPEQDRSPRIESLLRRAFQE